MNLDRFSQPSPMENEKPSLEMLDQLQEDTKKDMVYDFVDRYFDDCGRMPEVDTVVETFTDIDLDFKMVESTITHMSKYRK